MKVKKPKVEKVKPEKKPTWKQDVEKRLTALETRTDSKGDKGDPGDPGQKGDPGENVEKKGFLSGVFSSE